MIVTSLGAVVFVGVSYKRDVADWRESPALKLLELLERDGAVVVYHDPFVPEIVDHDGRARHSVALDAPRLREADCVVALCDHSTIDRRLVAEVSGLVVDTRNVCADAGEAAHIVRL